MLGKTREMWGRGSITKNKNKNKTGRLCLKSQLKYFQNWGQSGWVSGASLLLTHSFKAGLFSQTFKLCHFLWLEIIVYAIIINRKYFWTSSEYLSSFFPWKEQFKEPSGIDTCQEWFEDCLALSDGSLPWMLRRTWVGLELGELAPTFHHLLYQFPATT